MTESDPDRAAAGPGYTVEDVDEVRTLVVSGPWSREVEEAVVREDAAGLVLNYARGFEPDLEHGELEFLGRHLRVRRLDVLDRGVRDLTPIYRLGDTLEELSVQAAPSAHIEFGELPRVRVVAGDWMLIGPTLGALEHLRELVTWRFDSPDLTPLSDHAGLERLTVKDAPRLESLDGLEASCPLRCVDVRGVRRLVDISALAAFSSTLTTVRLEKCAVASLHTIAQLHDLRFLEIGDCGHFPSASELRRLNALEALYAWGSTRFTDPDLSPLLTLPALREIRMQNRRHYRPPLADVLAAIERRDQPDH